MFDFKEVEDDEDKKISKYNPGVDLNKDLL